MTPEEAYATCHAAIVYVTSKLASLPEICDPEKHRAALRDRYDLDVLANAVEQMYIAQKPKKHMSGAYLCPHCGSPVIHYDNRASKCRPAGVYIAIRRKDHHCPYCGQKIDWSEFSRV